MTVDPVMSKLLSTTDSSEWELVDTLELRFETDHPQGLLRVGYRGDRWFLSSVRFQRTDAGKPDPSTVGRGFLIEFERDGDVLEEKGRLELGEGLVYHPGGMASEGTVIYVPVSEYRPDSSCHIYKVDVEKFEVLGEPVQFPDHIGALSIDPERRRIFGMSWASRRIYIWDYEWNLLHMNLNPIENVAYQDIDFRGGNTLACAGVWTFDLGGQQVEIGGLDLIDATTWLPHHRIMVTTRTHTGRLLVNNAFSHKLVYPDLFLGFVPDDDEGSQLQIYRV